MTTNITLINATRRMKVLNLPHASYCEARGACACTRSGDRRLASSLTLSAGAVLEGLDEAVLAVPQVLALVRAGELRVRRVASPRKSNPTPKKNEPRKATRRSGRKKAR